MWPRVASSLDCARAIACGKFARWPRRVSTICDDLLTIASIVNRAVAVTEPFRVANARDNFRGLLVWRSEQIDIARERERSNVTIAYNRF